MSIGMQKRGARWTASVRLNGHTVSGTFDLKTTADKWAQRVRKAIDDAHSGGRVFDPLPFKKVVRTRKAMPTATEAQDEIDRDGTPRPDWTVGRAFRHYDATVSGTLKGVRQVKARIAAWRRDPLAKVQLRNLKPGDVEAWVLGRTKVRRIRLKEGGVRIERHPVAASTVCNDVYRLSALYEQATRPVTKKKRDVAGWGLDLKNPVAAVSMPTLPDGRQRRLDADGDEGEEAKLLAALADGPDGVEMASLVTLALETALRRSEILSLTATEVRSTRMGRVIEKPDSKNGSSRRVVLTDRAAGVVDRLRAGKTGTERLFTLDADAVRYRWNRARAKADCHDLRLHDIRHEAMSGMADAGLSIGALAAQGGYKTTKTLLRYVNASEKDIREKLAKASRADVAK